VCVCVCERERERGTYFQFDCFSRRSCPNNVLTLVELNDKSESIPVYVYRVVRIINLCSSVKSSRLIYICYSGLCRGTNRLWENRLDCTDNATNAGGAWQCQVKNWVLSRDLNLGFWYAMRSQNKIETERVFSLTHRLYISLTNIRHCSTVLNPRTKLFPE
jgi:hypothetical protein